MGNFEFKIRTVFGVFGKIYFVLLINLNGFEGYDDDIEWWAFKKDKG